LNNTELQMDVPYSVPLFNLRDANEDRGLVVWIHGYLFNSSRNCFGLGILMPI